MKAENVRNRGNRFVAIMLLVFLAVIGPIYFYPGLLTRAATNTLPGDSFTLPGDGRIQAECKINDRYSTEANQCATSAFQAYQTFIPILTRASYPALVFAALGDYGSETQAEADVAQLVRSWDPDFVITLGDNNYPVGGADHIDAAIGQFFHSYIYPYLGSYGEGASENQFFPALGNHDLLSENGQPYYDYFTLPGNERYYDFERGAVHFFVLNDNSNEPDGVSSHSIQAAWLHQQLAASTSPWNIVYMHLPPYSSGMHGSTTYAQWPYGQWGADAVLAGHDHTYERLSENGVPYFVNGVGGESIYNFVNILPESQVRYNGGYGAMRIEASGNRMDFEFINRDNVIIDTYTLWK